MNSTLILITIVIVTGLSITIYSLPYMAESEQLPTKGELINTYIDNIANDFRVPKYISEGYELYSAEPSQYDLVLYFKPINKEKPDPRYMIVFGAHKNDPRILEGKQAFLDYKSKTQRSNVIQIFEINGNPAMGWEVGKKNIVLMFDNGTKRIIGESAYPASIVMIDQRECHIVLIVIHIIR
ncbi:MAG: hypothetical protein KatS3mg003_1332 [Candidatus Nitrosocaldaceae archaeon]|nr:MAG: hypothetical protein KatS3mg003_1332 [Candidatus Nitrosocaldaceae archaeon]